MVPGQQPPQGGGVPLNAVCAADNQNGVIQHLEGALHLAGEVHMARCVQQGQVQAVQRQAGLFGENGDAPLPLLSVGVQKGVPVVHPSQAAQLAALIEQRLRQGGLARIHMGKQTSTNAFEHFFLWLIPHHFHFPS